MILSEEKTDINTTRKILVTSTNRRSQREGGKNR